MNMEFTNNRYPSECRFRDINEIDTCVIHLLERNNPDAGECARNIQDRIPLYHYIVDESEIYQSVPGVFVVDNDTMISRENQNTIHIAVLMHEGQFWAFDTLSSLISSMEWNYGVYKYYLASSDLISVHTLELLMGSVEEDYERLKQIEERDIPDKEETRTWTKEDQDAFYEWF